MPRLPVPGGDANTWGDVLNEYLQVSHTADGSLSSSAVDSAIAAGSIDEAQLADDSVSLRTIDTSNVAGNNQVLSWNGTTLAWADNGVSDHGALGGLADDDHLQYALADGTRGSFATTAQGTLADTAVQPGDDANTLGSGAATDGYVLTADGAGNTAWEVSSGSTDTYVAATEPAGLADGNIWIDTSEDYAADGSGGHEIQDEGVALTQRAALDFVGDGVTVTDDSGNDKTVVTIPGGGGVADSIPTFTAAHAVGVGTLRWYNDTGNSITIAGARATISSDAVDAATVVDVNVDDVSALDAPISITVGTRTIKVTDEIVIPADSYLTIDVDSVGTPGAGETLAVQFFIGGN